MNQTKQKFKLSGSYMLREICGEYAVIPVGTDAVISNAILQPNDTAVYLWKLFITPMTEEEILKKVLEEYEGPTEVIQSHIHSFVLDGLHYGYLKEEI